MLEIRPNCENCGRDLSPDSSEAMICSFECTYCMKCALDLLNNVCPNCGGGFYARPVRPKALLKKYPPDQKRIHKPVDLDQHRQMILKYSAISAHER